MTSEYILNSWRFWKLCHLVPTRALALDSWGITEPPTPPPPPPKKKKPTEISLPKKYLDNCYFYGLLYIPVKSVKVLCVSLPCRFVCPYDCLFFSLTVLLVHPKAVTNLKKGLYSPLTMYRVDTKNENL